MQHVWVEMGGKRAILIWVSEIVLPIVWKAGSNLRPVRLW